MLFVPPRSREVPLLLGTGVEVGIEALAPARFHAAARAQGPDRLRNTLVGGGEPLIVAQVVHRMV